MGFLSGLFGSKKEEVEKTAEPVLVDMHSHLLPGIDDGSDSFDESVEMIQTLMQMGYRHFITTPHIMSDFYTNNRETILPKLDELRNVLKERNIDVTIEAGAEYYIDDGFEKIMAKEEMLHFGSKKYVLVETSYLSSPPNFNEAIFNLKIAGYTPILAHPERYAFMYNDFNKYHALFERDICFQVNLASLAGYYSKEAKKIAEKLIQENMVHFVGTDIHHVRHLKPLKEAQNSSAYNHLTQLKLKNNSLLPA